jgi:hypothetical protein
MTPTEKGKFCSSCEKEVYDFSNSTDEQIVKQPEGKEMFVADLKPFSLFAK